MAGNETIADIIAEMRALSNPISDGIIAINGRSIADRLEVAQRRDCASIERIVRDAILGYGEMFRTAPNDESEAELKARAETANIWLERHGFTREEITWTKEEASEL
jgi:hypothetical protein